MKILQAILISFLVVILVAACASSGPRIKQSDIDKIVIGQTTEEQIKEFLGDPFLKFPNSDGKTTAVWNYRISYAFSRFVNHKTLSVLFDDQGKVEKLMVTKSKIEVRQGP